MKKDFNDAIMKLVEFCHTYNDLSMEDKLLFAVLGPKGSEVAATLANEINEPNDDEGTHHFDDGDYESYTINTEAWKESIDKWLNGGYN